MNSMVLSRAHPSLSSLRCLTYPDSASFLLVDGDLVPVDIDVGQAHVGHSLVAPVVVLLIYGERDQRRIISTVLGNGISTGALEVKVPSVEGVVVRVPPAPALCGEVRDAGCVVVLSLARFFLSTGQGFAGI